MLRVVRIDRNGCVAEPQIFFGIGFCRRDLFPCTGFGIVFPHGTILHACRPRICSVCYIKVAVRGKCGVRGAELDGLSRHGAPTLAEVAAHEKVVAPHQRNPHIYCRTTFALHGSGGVEMYEDHTASARCPAAESSSRRGCGFGHVGKRAHRLPADALVAASPQAIETCAQIYGLTVCRIDHHPLAVAPSVLVAAHREGHIDTPESATAVVGDKHGAIGTTGISARRKVDGRGIVRIDGYAFDTHEIVVGVGYPVCHRLPPSQGSIPAIGAPHVGAAVTYIFGRGVENYAVHESSADDLYAFPQVCLRRN